MPASSTDGPVSDVADAARGAYARLRDWLLGEVFPHWCKAGADEVRGGFHERLAADGSPLDDPRRARVQARQIYSFARARRLGWTGDVTPVLQRGVEFFVSRYRRPDGLYRTLVSAAGDPLDERALLYDQAFALLAFAALAEVPGAAGGSTDAALALRDRMVVLLGRPGGFHSGLPDRLPLLSNPHMHLLEAALEWRAVSADPGWDALAGQVVTLALNCFIDGGSGVVREVFDDRWRPAPGVAGRIIEPGHQFEWAWLLLRWSGGTTGAARQRAERLVDIGERFGVRRGVAVNALLDDLSVRDADARLWPQTERLKAAARMASLTGEPRWWESAAAAAASVLRYRNPARPALWFDCFTDAAGFVQEPSPASTLYHLVAAVTELGAALGAP